jgi:hypothetical protein
MWSYGEDLLYESRSGMPVTMNPSHAGESYAASVGTARLGAQLAVNSRNDEEETEGSLVHSGEASFWKRPDLLSPWTLRGARGCGEREGAPRGHRHRLGSVDRFLCQAATLCPCWKNPRLRSGVFHLSALSTTTGELILQRLRCAASSEPY